jgi:hypothetical protein
MPPKQKMVLQNAVLSLNGLKGQQDSLENNLINTLSGSSLSLTSKIIASG